MKILFLQTNTNRYLVPRPSDPRWSHGSCNTIGMISVSWTS